MLLSELCKVNPEALFISLVQAHDQCDFGVNVEECLSCVKAQCFEVII